jgi:hypothetical protein
MSIVLVLGFRSWVFGLSKDLRPKTKDLLNMQLHHVHILQHIIAFDLGAVVDGGTPDAGEFEVVAKILVDHARHLQQRAAALMVKGRSRSASFAEGSLE